MAHRPTREQQAALAQALTRQSFKVVAYAGAGKTTTLQQISEAIHSDNPRARGLYVAFNKAIATEARARFGQHVDCRTFHSLAYRFVPRDITAKLSLPKPTPSMTAKAFRLQRITLRKVQGGKRTAVDITAAQQAAMVGEALANFCSTHAAYPAPRHITLPDWVMPADADELRTQLYPVLELSWQQAIDPDHQGGINHDIYLKLWALSKPRIPAEFVLFDEAQDADPLMLGVLMNQSDTQVIYVGDAHQQIYEWRGAVSAMQRLPLPEARLTKSFRFGSSIAGLANTLLTELGETHPLRGAEHDDQVQHTGGLYQKNAILCRTNASALARLFKGVKDGSKVALQADTQRLLGFAEASEKLRAGKRVTNLPELRLFGSWGEIQEYAEYHPKSELSGMIRLVDEHGHAALKKVLAKAVTSDKADYVISTAHKAKGLEWDSVELDDDYLFEVTDKGEPKISSEELRLLYVAATRAKKTLGIQGVLPLIKALEKKQLGKTLPSRSVLDPKSTQGAENP